MIRSVAADPSDALLCMMLAQNAVHGAMAGFTCFSAGICANKNCYLPIPALVQNSPRQMDCKKGRTWERVLAMTGQPNRPCGESAE
jgi:6-phosphofructokinase 1